MAATSASARCPTAELFFTAPRLENLSHSLKSFAASSAFLLASVNLTDQSAAIIPSGRVASQSARDSVLPLFSPIPLRI
jgi:hypothetical protein